MPRHPARDRLTRSLPFALTGVLAAVAGIAVGHLVAGLLDPASSPVLAVGSAVIDATPTPVKEYAVAQFGTRDKPILLGSVTVVTLLASAVAGVLARRRTWLGVAFILLLTGLATLAALTRPVAAPVDALPGVAAAVTGVAVLLGLLTALRGRRPATRADAPARAAGHGVPHRPRRPAHVPARRRRGDPGRGRCGDLRAAAGLGRRPGVDHPARAGDGRAAPPAGPGAHGQGHQPAAHRQRHVLPRRHQPHRAQGRRRPLEAHRRRDGRPALHALLRRPAGDADDRARHHPDLRLQRGRRRLRRRGPLARGARSATSSSAPASGPVPTSCSAPPSTASPSAPRWTRCATAATRCSWSA